MKVRCALLTKLSPNSTRSSSKRWVKILRKPDSPNSAAKRPTKASPKLELVRDDVDELAGDDDDLSYRFSFDEVLHIFVGKGGGFGVFFGDVGRDLDAGAELAIDLDDELDFGFDEEAFIELGPALFAYQFAFAEGGVDLFGEVWREGAEELEEGKEEVFGNFLCGGVSVGALHHGADGGVEAEGVDRFFDALDGLMGDFAQSLHFLTVVRRCALGVGHFSAELPVAFGVFGAGDAPDFGEEAVDAFNAFHSPGFVLIKGTHEHLVEAEGVSAVIFDDVIRVDDITEGFGHFLSVLAHDETGGEVFFERFLGLEVAEVVEDFVPEAGVEKMEDGVFFSADVEVDEGVVISPVAFGIG